MLLNVNGCCHLALTQSFMKVHDTLIHKKTTRRFNALGFSKFSFLDFPFNFLYIFILLVFFLHFLVMVFLFLFLLLILLLFFLIILFLVFLLLVLPLLIWFLYSKTQQKRIQVKDKRKGAHL